MSSFCRYCGRVELMFDQSRKSQSGKLIPLDKSSGLPHSCDSNPYNKGQSSSTTNGPNNIGPVTNESTDLLLQIQLLHRKIDKLLEAKEVVQ